MIVGLSGYAQAGKDTAAEVFQRYGFQRYSFADPMREMALAIDPIVAVGQHPEGGLKFIRYSEALEEIGYEKAKEELPEVRTFLQKLGTDAGRNVLGEDVWVDAALKYMREGGDYVIPDVRFPNEADAIRDEGGLVFRVQRPDHGPANDHPSETALDDYDFDHFLFNCGTIEALREAAWSAYMLRRKVPA
jgi:hypothetical protein